VRGARDADGNQRHLLAALVGRTAQTSVIAAQAEVGVKTNEVPMVPKVLGQIDLHGKLVSADALHTVKATAEFIHHGGGQFVLPVKEKRKALFDAIDALPWHEVPVAHSATDRSHGRITTRTIQVLPALEDLPFPHVKQVMLIERYVTDLHGSPVSAVAALGLVSPAPDQVSAAGLAWHVREQWAIESLHWLRHSVPRRQIAIDARNLKPTKEQRAMITADGLHKLNRWFDRALTAATAADIFKDDED
jgi:predicted transposase YbfD/YdcC